MRFASAMVALVLLAGCAVGGNEVQKDPGPSRDLASTPSQLDEQAARSVRRTASRPEKEKPGERRRPKRSEGTPRDDGSSSTAGDAPTEFIRLALGRDPSSDHGGGPGYADLRSLSLDATENSARFVIYVNGLIPDRLAKREVMGIGIDVFLGGGRESDYQVFIDGGPDGWWAYLQTPQGFVEFPGTFGFDREVIVVTLPWSSLGDATDGEMSAFLDRSDARSDPVQSSEDFLPQSDRIGFSR